jgi:MFS family permease
MNQEIHKALRFNIQINLLQGAFHGAALSGFASFVTVFPLFVSQMTDSPILISLIPAIQTAGWHLPQLFTARLIIRQPQIRSLVVRFSLLERLPFLGLAAVAFLLPKIGLQVGLVLTFSLLIIQRLGSGLTANPWQSMIGKIVPSDRRGAFFGMHMGAAYLLGSIGSVLAGQILERNTGAVGFGWCFLLAAVMLAFGWFFLKITREPLSVNTIPQEPLLISGFVRQLSTILQNNRPFCWFIVGRMVSQLSLIGYAFYTVYAVSHHRVSVIEIGWMTGIFMVTNIAANVLMGWLGDRWSNSYVMQIGLLAMSGSSLLAWWAPAPIWFYLVFSLAAIGLAAIWTVALTMTLEYGSEEERPTYIGLTNTLIAPASILAPLFGGWLAKSFGYPSAFMTSAIGAFVAMIIFMISVKDQPAN